MTDVFKAALEAQQVADERFAVAEAEYFRVKALRGSVSGMDGLGQVFTSAMPLLKRFLPIVAGAGGVGAVMSDPSLLGGLLSQVAGVFGG